MARDTLGLLKYTLTDSNNYLIDPVEPFTENNFRERETLSSSPMAEQQLTGNNELGEINNSPSSLKISKFTSFPNVAASNITIFILILL